eukprot:7989807-Alexandrium_andersonii.AAC.1
MRDHRCPANECAQGAQPCESAGVLSSDCKPGWLRRRSELGLQAAGIQPARAEQACATLGCVRGGPASIVR